MGRADGSDSEDADAQYLLGARYREGDGVAATAAEAVRRLRRAAEQGHPRAQNTLGHCYFTGNGVAKDPATTVGWFRRAAEQGHARAQYNLGWCYQTGHGVVADPARAFEWTQRAAEQGMADAAFAVGSAYQFGCGVAKDLRHALHWMERAQSTVRMSRRQVRILRWKLHPILRYSHRTMWVAGLALLTYHAVTVPFSIRWQAVALYVGIVVAAAVGVTVIGSLLGIQALDRAPEDHGLLVQRARRVVGLGVQIAYEDGLFLVPVLHVGITLPAAIIAGTAFGLSHFPWFRCRPASRRDSRTSGPRCSCCRAGSGARSPGTSSSMPSASEAKRCFAGSRARVGTSVDLRTVSRLERCE